MDSSKPDYNLNTFNCTTWVVQVLSMIGINAPSNTSTWPFGKGLNPGQFGEDLKKWGPLNSTDKTGGNAPANAGTCF